jgi:AcrR family transcriptional regulator
MPTDTEKVGRPRGRPRSFDENEVLDRVKEVFHEKGFSAASLDDLCAAAGLNRPSLYAAFGNKEDLYIRVIARMGAQSVSGIDFVMGGPGAVEERLSRLYRHAIKSYTAGSRPRGCMIVGTATVEAPTHGRIAVAASAFIAGNESALQRHFETAVAGGMLAAVPAPPARARLAGALFDTLAIRARLGSPAAELDTVAETTIPLICAGKPGR